MGHKFKFIAGTRAGFFIPLIGNSNMKINKYILSILIGSFILPVMAVSSTVNTREVVPSKNIGSINKSTSEKELIKLYGKKNISRFKINVGEGMTVDGSVLFKGTKDEMSIEWKGDFKQPGRVTIKHPESTWLLKNGIEIGSTLQQVEKINGKSFKLTGFEWDYPGRTTSWGGGKLSKQLQLDFEPQAQVPGNELSQVIGDSSFSSQHKIIKKLKLKVKTIYIRWDL